MPLSTKDTMNKLSKEKRNQLVLVVLLTVGALVGLWYGLIRFQQERLRSLAKKTENAQNELKDVRQAIADADRIEAQLGEDGVRLTKFEEGMASGDLYSWAFNTIRKFKVSYKVEIPQFSQVDGPKEVSLLPHFPYKQANLMLAGTAQFHDLGKFVADFENQFPYFRILNLNVEPVSLLAGADREKLAFRMEVAALVRPGGT
jgi:hypothetical protein